MQFRSIKSPNSPCSLKEALFRGLAADSSLYMPVQIPQLASNFIERSKDFSFKQTCFALCQHWFAGVLNQSLIDSLIDEAFNFDVPLRDLGDHNYLLELFHGPSLAFKDVGARFMAGLMSRMINPAHEKVTVLVATSGDTGAAVAQAFHHRPGFQVYVLYPKGQVSRIQEQQLITLGGNIHPLKVAGSFDDCQSLVKQAFVDAELTSNFLLTSANSINIARLIPQSFYFMQALISLEKLGISSQEVVFSVPSGNFGNVCAGLLLKKMGVQIGHFIAATNANDTVPRFFKNGLLEPRPSIATLSNAMDVGNPSNLSRILELYGNDLTALQADLQSVGFDDEQTKVALREMLARYKIISEPHTAIAWNALKHHRPKDMHGVALATAHPAKFNDRLLQVLGQEAEVPASLKNAILTKGSFEEIDNNFNRLKERLLSA